MDITRGSLDCITKSARAHQRQRPDSRVSLRSGGASPATLLETRGSLEILPPEPSFDYQDCDLALEEYLTSSDEDDPTYTNTETEHEDAIHQLERLILSRNSSDLSTSDASPIDEGHKSQASNNQTGSHGPGASQQENGDDDDEYLKGIEDPKLRKAMKKMRKLDKILSEKVSREREVKRQRATMHKQYLEELEQIRLGLDRSQPKEEVENTTRFLALVPPPAHSEGLDHEDNVASSPLFHTQPPEGEGSVHSQISSDRSSSVLNSLSSSRLSKRDSESVKDTGRSKAGKKRRSKVDAGHRSHRENTDEDDNFIQRNIQLACDAGNTIAMTDDEKKRLGELLQDIEMLGKDTETSKECSGLALQTMPGIGYHPDTVDETTLKNLDNKLKMLMPAECFLEICSTPSLQWPAGRQQDGYSREVFELGERVLGSNKESRDHQDRLKEIEAELEQLQTQVEKEISSPSLTKDELDDLFRQCDDVDTRTQSVLSSPRTPRPGTPSWNTGDHSGGMPREDDNDNSDKLGMSDRRYTTKLPEDTLRRLLEEAKERLGFEEPVLDGNIPDDGVDYGEDGDASSDDGDDTWRTESKLSQMSSTITRVPLVSHDVIQSLLRNPRVTLEEAQSTCPCGMDGVRVDDVTKMREPSR